MADIASGRLSTEANKIADKIRSSERTIVVSHIDADGISAAAVASSALDNAEIDHEVIFLKKLDDRATELLCERSKDALIWLTDLGSAHESHFAGRNVVITDHHETEEQFLRRDGSVQTRIFSFSRAAHLNPHFFGHSGSREISGAGLAFLVAMEMNDENRDSVQLPIVGAIGDMQDREAGRLIGLNSSIADFGVKEEKVIRSIDIRLFGTETRPLTKFLQYASEPKLPGLSGDPRACEDFLRMHDVDTVGKNGESRHWSDLGSKEKRRIVNALSRLILENGGDQEDVRRLMGEMYIFPGERKGIPTREAREFATLLNSCGRNDMPHLGMEICKGDRASALDEALEMLRTHRENISSALEFVKVTGVRSSGRIQHFHCADQVKDTVIGIIAGMLLGSGEVDPLKPIVGFAISQEESGEYKVKASIRGDRGLVDRGLNLATAARLAAESVGGVGGGHNIAAGATLPLGKEEEFLAALERQVKNQLSNHLTDRSSMAF